MVGVATLKNHPITPRACTHARSLAVLCLCSTICDPASSCLSPASGRPHDGVIFASWFAAILLSYARIMYHTKMCPCCSLRARLLCSDPTAASLDTPLARTCSTVCHVRMLPLLRRQVRVSRAQARHEPCVFRSAPCSRPHCTCTLHLVCSMRCCCACALRRLRALLDVADTSSCLLIGRGIAHGAPSRLTSSSFSFSFFTNLTIVASQLRSQPLLFSRLSFSVRSLLCSRSWSVLWLSCVLYHVRTISRVTSLSSASGLQSAGNFAS